MINSIIVDQTHQVLLIVIVNVSSSTLLSCLIVDIFTFVNDFVSYEERGRDK